MQTLWVYSFLFFGIFCMRSPWPPEGSAEEVQPPVTHCIWAMQVQKERGCAIAFCVAEMLALGLRRGSWSPACPGTFWDHGHLYFYGPFPLVPLGISLWNWNGGAIGLQRYFISRGDGVNLSFLEYAAGLRRALFRDTFSHHCCRSCQPCVPTLLHPHLGQQHQHTLSTAPLASCGPGLTNLPTTEC